MRIFRQRLLFSWSSMFHRKCLLRSIIIFTVFTSFMPLLIEGFPIPSWGSRQNSKALDPGAFPPYLQATKIEKPSCLRKARRSLNIKECSSLFEGKIVEKIGREKYVRYVKGSFLYSRIPLAKPEAVWTLMWYYDYNKQLSIDYGWESSNRNFPEWGTFYKCVYHNSKKFCL